MCQLPEKARKAAQKALAERSLASFSKMAWPHMGEFGKYHHNWHIDAIAEHLEAVSDGQIKRLLINIPPRFMKSSLCSVAWPAWTWIRKPSIRWLCASHSLQLAIRDNRKCRNLIESQWYQSHWSNTFNFTKDQNAKSRFENNQGGYKLAVSVGSSLTGEGGDIIVIDDPHNAQDIDHAQRVATLDWFDGALSTRLNDPATGAMVLIMQRLHSKDLAGHVLDRGDWEQLVLPAEYEGSKHVTSIGWSDPRTETGQLLWPQRVGPIMVAELKHILGSMRYAAQYQQQPVPASGGQFKQEYFRYYKREQIGKDLYFVVDQGGDMVRYPDDKITRFLTVDLAVSKKQEADYTVIALWGQTPDKKLLLLDLIRSHMSNPEQVAAITRAHQQHSPAFIGIETVAYQLALVQQLQSKGLPVKEYKPKGDKVGRATIASVLYEQGSIYHPTSSYWLVDYETELLRFPKAEHDDCVDVVSVAAYYLGCGMEPRIRLL